MDGLHGSKEEPHNIRKWFPPQPFLKFFVPRKAYSQLWNEKMGAELLSQIQSSVTGTWLSKGGSSWAMKSTDFWLLRGFVGDEILPTRFFRSWPKLVFFLKWPWKRVKTWPPFGWSLRVTNGRSLAVIIRDYFINHQWFQNFWLKW